MEGQHTNTNNNNGGQAAAAAPLVIAPHPEPPPQLAGPPPLQQPPPQHQWFGGPMLVVDHPEAILPPHKRRRAEGWNHRYRNGASHYYPPPPPGFPPLPVNTTVGEVVPPQEPPQPPKPPAEEGNKTALQQQEEEEEEPEGPTTTPPNKFKARNRATWPQMLEQLQAFKAKTGHCNVPCRYKANPSLAHWVKTQRYKFSQEHMTADRVDALEKEGFEWRRASTELFDQRWNLRFKELVEYKERFGDTRVPFEWPENKALSMWVSRERQNYKRGLLRKDKYDRLESIGFDWNLAEFGKGIRPDRMRNSKKGDYPEEAELQPPPAMAPKIPPPPEVAPQNLPALPPRPGQLDPSHNKRHAKWLEMFQQLQEFQQEHGHCVAPQPRKGNNVLGRWVKNQHDNYTKGLLYADQIEKLESLGIVWRLRAFGSGKDRKHDVEKFRKKLAELVEFQHQHGHSVQPSKHTVLGEWASRQRFLFRRNCLPEERVALLNEIHFVWQTRKSWKLDWEEQLAKLRVYKTMNGHCRFPQVYDEDPDLAKWVQQQRDLYEKKELEPSTIEQMESIGFVWDLAQEDDEPQDVPAPPDAKKLRLDHAALQMELSQLRNKLQEERVKLRHQKVQAMGQQNNNAAAADENNAPKEDDPMIQMQEQRVTRQEERIQWHQQKMILQLENNGLVAANQKLRETANQMEEQVEAQQQLLQTQSESLEAQSKQLKAHAELIQKQSAQLQQLKELVLKKGR